MPKPCKPQPAIDRAGLPIETVRKPLPYTSKT